MEVSVVSGWDRVWAARRLAPGGPEGVSEATWYEFVERVAETLDIGPGTTVFDVGCGSGAFLYPLAENGYVVGGLETSPALASVASDAMPEGAFTVGDAVSLDPGRPWDAVVAFGVLGSLANLDDARGLLARMLAMSTHAVAVLDVPDIDPSGGPAPGGGLAYDRGWVLHALADMGASAVQIEDQRLDGDTRAGSRFNVFVQV